MIRLILLLPLFLLMLLGQPPATVGAPLEPPTNPPTLAGRNCGGTLLILPGPDEPAGMLAAAGAGWGPGFPVDAVASAQRQIAPSAALLPDLRPIYVWQEVSERDGGDIFLAMPGAALAQDGRAAVRVDDTGTATIDQRAPVVVADANGRIVVVWQDRRLGRGAFYDLFYAVSNDNGTSWSVNRSVGTPTTAQPSWVEPFLLADADQVLLLWRAAGSFGDLILFSRLDAQGWTEPQQVNASVEAFRGRPTMARLPDGDLLAAWQDARFGYQAIFTGELDRSAAATSWLEHGRATPRGIEAGGPSLAIAGDGNSYMAYQGLAGIFLIGRAPDSTTWSLPQLIDDGAVVTNPRLVIDSYGGIHCIWCALFGSADIKAARSTDGGSSWSEPVTLASTSGTAEPLALLADQAGNVYAAWSDGNDLSETLYTARWGLPRLYLPELFR